VRPQITSDANLKIIGGRHPVVESALPKGDFAPNDLTLSKEGCRFMLLTGPNMSGKSTYLRQTGLIVLLAQMGSFVPAEAATLPLIDRIFTRVGAQDDVAGGRSTFMVEMNEAAHIVSQASSNSLLLIDEIGRGTSTFDGMAIAAALAEHIHDAIGAFTIFSTHYHELTQLPHQKPGMQNFNVAVEDQGDTIIFLHRVEPGPAPGSYGIHVAKMAGLPLSVSARAQALLERLESSGGRLTGKARQLQLF
jgi:DNA mismatch repair protein MutS